MSLQDFWYNVMSCSDYTCKVMTQIYTSILDFSLEPKSYIQLIIFFFVIKTQCASKYQNLVYDPKPYKKCTYFTSLRSDFCHLLNPARNQNKALILAVDVWVWGMHPSGTYRCVSDGSTAASTQLKTCFRVRQIQTQLGLVSVPQFPHLQIK